MFLLKTVKEKAVEWNISPRQLQYMCKKGLIEGAIKKAGAWFIPDGTPIPAQYSNAGTGRFNFTGTKRRIFECAIDLFKCRGYENVGIKDIADTAGIKQSSVYNHFKSKQEILDTIYDYYSSNYLLNRPNVEELDEILRNGSLTDIIQSVTYTFESGSLRQMFNITSIIFHRCAIDEKARQLTKSLMVDAGLSYAKSVFDRAVEIGRIAPADTRALAVFVNSVKLYMLHLWLASSEPEDFSGPLEDERRLYRYASLLLTDLGDRGV